MCKSVYSRVQNSVYAACTFCVYAPVQCVYMAVQYLCIGLCAKLPYRAKLSVSRQNKKTAWKMSVNHTVRTGVCALWKISLILQVSHKASIHSPKLLAPSWRYPASRFAQLAISVQRVSFRFVRLKDITDLFRLQVTVTAI